MLAFKNFPELLKLSRSVNALFDLKHEHVYNNVLEEIKKIDRCAISKNTNLHLNENLKLLISGFIDNAGKFRLKYSLNVGRNKFMVDNDYVVIIGRLSVIKSKLKQIS